MTEEILTPGARVTLESAGPGRTRVSVEAESESLFLKDRTWTTAYPRDLIEAILAVKGPGWLCDELRRDEDPTYLENDLRHDVFGFITPAEMAGRTVLDFGCGCGASISVLGRLAAAALVTGIELDGPSLAIARRRAAYYDLGAELLLSPSPRDLPPGIGPFDFILFSAVFEHLLPEERLLLLPMVWSLLKPGGLIFINQTPHRYFPIEGHTTGLPLLNYLPDRLAHLAARRFSPRVDPATLWPDLLRGGIRGGTPREIMGILRGARDGVPVNLEPKQDGLRDHLDLWDRSSRVRHAGTGHTLKVAALRAMKSLTGVALVPNISLAVRKMSPEDRSSSEFPCNV